MTMTGIGRDRDSYGRICRWIVRVSSPPRSPLAGVDMEGSAGGANRPLRGRGKPFEVQQPAHRERVVIKSHQFLFT